MFTWLGEYPGGSPVELPAGQVSMADVPAFPRSCWWYRPLMSIVPVPTASTNPGSSLEMHVLGSYPRSTETGVWRCGPAIRAWMHAYLCSLKCESAAPTMCLQWLKSGGEWARLIICRVVGTRESWFFLNQSEILSLHAPSWHSGCLVRASEALWQSGLLN